MVESDIEPQPQGHREQSTERKPPLPLRSSHLCPAEILAHMANCNFFFLLGDTKNPISNVTFPNLY